MGVFYHKCFPDCAAHNSTLLNEKIRPPSFMGKNSIECIIKNRGSKVVKDDKEHFFKNEEWFKEICDLNHGKSFLDINRFIENYPHYKIDQVFVSFVFF